MSRNGFTNMNNTGHYFRTRGITLEPISVRLGSTERAVLTYGEVSTGLVKPKGGKKPAVSLAPPESRLAGVKCLDPKIGGYSDVRMWPCYVVMCVATLISSKWLGFGASLVFIGLPSFVFAIYLTGVTKSEDTTASRFLLYENIDRKYKEHEEKNRLLRRNMKIIQAAEQEQKALRRSKPEKLDHKLGKVA